MADRMKQLKSVMQYCRRFAHKKSFRTDRISNGTQSGILMTTPMDARCETVPGKQVSTLGVFTEYASGLLHKHGAIQISYNFEHPFTLYLDDMEGFEVYFGIIPSDTPHKIVDVTGRYQSVLLDPLSPLGKKIGRIAEREDLFKDLIKCIMENIFLLPLGVGPVEMQACSAHNFIEKLTGLASTFPEPEIDGRIEKAMKKCETRGGRELALAHLSRWIFLSKSRSYHLFKQEAGITFTKYLKWIKTLEAVKYRCHYRSNITEAAHMAGFSDASHFSRSFKEMFGIPPSCVLNRSLAADCC